MTKAAKVYLAIVASLLAVSPVRAETCTQAIANVQAQVDAAIEKRATSDRWKTESLNALRNHQPTPRTIAATEAARGRQFEAALDSLDRARAADRSGDIALCRKQVAYARAVLRR